MGFLDAIKAVAYGAPGPDPAQRVPALAPLIQAMQGDPRPMWPAFAASVAAMPDLRIDAIQALVNLYWMKQPAGARASLDALVAADPASWLMVRCYLRIAEGWEARGSGSTIKNGALFSQKLNEARSDAEYVMGADPRDPAPCAALMRIARGQGDDDLRDQAYAQATARNAGCFACHLAYNNAVSDRWGGSHEEQLAHARQIAGGAPPGHLNAGLPINALFYNFTHLICFDNDELGAGRFAANVNVVGEIAQICARSIDAPNHVVSASTLILRSQVAAMAWKGQQDAMARHHFPRLGDVYVSDVWEQCGLDGPRSFKAIRQHFGG